MPPDARRPGSALPGHVSSAIAAVIATVLLISNDGCCKRSTPSTTAPSASASASVAPAGSASASARVVRLSPPFDASIHAGKILVAGVERGTDKLVALSTSFDGAISAVDDLPSTGENKAPGDVGVFLNGAGVAVAIEGSVGAWKLVRGATSQSLSSASWQPIEATVCGTSKGLHTVRRVADGFQVFDTPISGGDWSPSGAASKLDGVSMICGTNFPFLFGDEGERQSARVFRDGGSLEVGILEDKDFSDEERGLHSKTVDDEFFAMRIGASSGIQVRRWDGLADHPSAWMKSALTFADDAVFEYVLVTKDHVVVVMSREAGEPRTCPDGDQPDTIAEVAAFSRVDGHVTRPPERIESWRCGAHPGPFFGGAVKGGVLIAWPRGADAACAKQRVHIGGVGFVTLNPEGGPRKVSNVQAPSEWIEFAGCDGERCAVAAIDRTHPDGSCAAAGDLDSGDLKIVVIP